MVMGEFYIDFIIWVFFIVCYMLFKVMIIGFLIIILDIFFFFIFVICLIILYCKKWLLDGKNFNFSFIDIYFF